MQKRELPALDDALAQTVGDYETLEASVGPTGLIVYAPNRQEDTLYYRMMDDLEKVRRGSSVNISPVYDNSPNLNQPNRIGQFRFRNIQIKGMGETIIHYSLVYSNSIYLSILGLSLLFR